MHQKSYQGMDLRLLVYQKCIPKRSILKKSFYYKIFQKVNQILMNLLKKFYSFIFRAISLIILIFYLEYTIFQMSQNIIRKELRQIQDSIDQQLNKIDKLLLLLSVKQQDVAKIQQKLAAKQMKIQWNGEDHLQNQSAQLNETCQQTNCNGSSFNLRYNFRFVWDCESQEILLDDYNLYDSIYVNEFILNTPKVIVVSTKDNWINNYLDEDDARVMLELDSGISVIKGIEKGFFKCHLCINENVQAQDFLIQSQIIYKIPSLSIEFPNHLKGYQLNLKVDSQSIIYQITIQSKCRMLFECLNQSCELIRFLMIKTDEQETSSIFWGAYSKQTLFQAIIMEAGTYILMPLPGNSSCNLYFDQHSQVIIKKDHEHSLKSFNLLKNLFEECRQSLKLTKSSSIFSDEEGIKKEFTRSCYMNFGIILEIYQNVYEYQAKFIDASDNKQDIGLLFEQIYTAEQIENRLSPTQKVIKFFVITEKPANLFIPKKKVLMGNRYMENQVYHAVFK